MSLKISVLNVFGCRKEDTNERYKISINIIPLCKHGKAISILKYKNFRLSDITKSNDVNEMSICFPRLFDEMINSYDAYDGFSYEFTYKEKDGREGFGILVKELRERIEKNLKMEPYLLL